ncbi:unnamed protein product [Phaeothamnion confervicola]
MQLEYLLLNPADCVFMVDVSDVRVRLEGKPLLSLRRERNEAYLCVSLTLLVLRVTLQAMSVLCYRGGVGPLFKPSSFLRGPPCVFLLAKKAYRKTYKSLMYSKKVFAVLRIAQYLATVRMGLSLCPFEACCPHYYDRTISLRSKKYLTLNVSSSVTNLFKHILV